MRIQVNLANEPFQRVRPILVVSAAGALALVAVFVLLMVLSRMETGDTREMLANIDRLQGRVNALAAEQARLEAVLREPANEEVLTRSLLLNNLIFAKGISWTRLFDDLEKVLPHNVRLLTIRPQVNGQNEISLDMVVGAESSEPVVQFLTRLETSPQFGSVTYQNRMPPSQSEPLLRYRLSVNYAQKL